MIRWTSTPLDRVFDEFLSTPEPGRRMMPVDIHRTDSALVVETDIPGYAPDEVDVSINDDMLTISANHEHEPPHGGAHSKDATSQSGECVRHERYWGSVRREIYLGRGLDTAGARAEFEDGVLRVTIPLQSGQQARRIEVQSRSHPQTSGLTQ